MAVRVAQLLLSGDVGGVPAGGPVRTTQPRPSRHPAGADAQTSPDMLLVAGEASLARGKQLVTERFFTARLADGSMPLPYRCAI